METGRQSSFSAALGQSKYLLTNIWLGEVHVVITDLQCRRKMACGSKDGVG